MTPNLAVLHVNYVHGPNFRLWLPLFLLVGSSDCAGAIHPAGAADRVLDFGSAVLAVRCGRVEFAVQPAGYGCAGFDRGQSESWFEFCRGGL